MNKSQLNDRENDFSFHNKKSLNILINDTKAKLKL